MEKTLVTWDWAEQFTLLNLVAKPAIDEILIKRLADICRRDGDTLTGLLLDAQMTDSLRSRRWTTALVEFALENAESGNKDVLDNWLAKWVPLGNKAIKVFAGGLGPEGDEMAAAAVADASTFRTGLGFDA